MATATEKIKSTPYAEFLAEREELMRFKWLASERAKRDVGLENALMEWAAGHRSEWRQRRNQLVKVRDK
ncbi:MAG: hypothetical protein H7A55_04570 [Verrucomicrobiaceae bacterium]|nr:hypothetical protein [Verrucomicrobiaceae bacterium]